jgi:hypothetical protein
MKTLLAFLLCLLLCIKAKADYGYRHLGEVVEKADYALVGTIVKLDINYFWLRVDSVLFGDIQGDTIPVMRFTDWGCAKRFAEYGIGQREIVFIRKSNHEIDKFEYVASAGADEFELPIIADSIVSYQYAYGQLKDFQLNEMAAAVRDYKNAYTQSPAQKIDVSAFAKKSETHKYLSGTMKYMAQNITSDPDYDGVSKRMQGAAIYNAEAKYLYNRYDNKLKIIIPGYNPKSLIIEVEEAEVRCEGNYYIVKPIDGWTRRWVNISVRNKNGDTTFLHQDIFNVYPVPDPQLFLGSSDIKDTMTREELRRTIRLEYARGKWKTDDYLKYEILAFDVDIIHNNQPKTLHSKNAWGNIELHNALSLLDVGDRVRYYNIVAKYPDGVVTQMQGKEIIVKK